MKKDTESHTDTLCHLEARSESMSRQVIKRLRGDVMAILGLVILLLIFAAAIGAPWLAPHDPADFEVSQRLAAPGRDHLLGTDELGRDILSRLMYGARVSLAVGFGSVALSSILGVSLGGIAGLFGGWIDAITSRIMDVLFAFPSILLAIALMAFLGTSSANVVLAIGITYTPRFARVARGVTLAAKEYGYVESARAIGLNNYKILTRHILPNILSPILIEISVSLAHAILVEASLSFLGLGVQPPLPSWGSMISSGKLYMEQSPWVTVFPGLTIMLTVAGFNFFGDGLRDALDPRLKS